MTLRGFRVIGALLVALAANPARGEDVPVEGGTLHILFQPAGAKTPKAWAKACGTLGRRLLVGKGPWRFGVFDRFDCRVAPRAPDKDQAKAAGPWDLRAVDDGKAWHLSLTWTAPRPSGNGTTCSTVVKELELPAGSDGLTLLAQPEFADLVALSFLDSMPMALPARLVPTQAKEAHHRFEWPKQPTKFATFDLAYDPDACLWRASGTEGGWAHALEGRKDRQAAEADDLESAAEQLLKERKSAKPAAAAPLPEVPGLAWTGRGGVPLLSGSGLLSRIPYLAMSLAYSRNGGGGPQIAIEGLPGVATSGADELGWWHAGIAWTAWWPLGAVAVSARPSLAVYSFKARQNVNAISMPPLASVGLDLGIRYTGSTLVVTANGGIDHAAGFKTHDRLTDEDAELNLMPRKPWRVASQWQLRPLAFLRTVAIEVSAIPKGMPAGTPPSTLDLEQVYAGAGLCIIW